MSWYPVEIASPPFSQTTAFSTPPGGDPWPPDDSVAGAKISIFQPQLESWNGNLLDACSAVTIKTPGNDESNYGVIPDGEHAARRAGDVALGIVARATAPTRRR